MPTVALELKEETLRLAQHSAEKNHLTVEQWLASAIENQINHTTSDDTILGLFKDIPEILDRVSEEAMTAREQLSLREAHEHISA